MALSGHDSDAPVIQLPSSSLLAWLTVLFVVVTAFRYIARVSKSMKLNRLFHKIHIPTGIILILTGLFHGLAAGNFSDTGLSDMRIGTVFFTFNWGAACFIVSVLLGLTYLLRKVLKKKWMQVHRILTVCMLVLMVLHIADVGIQLPSRLFDKKTGSANSQDVINDEIKEEIKDEINDSVTFSGAQLEDGVYEGSAEGYKSTIKVSVTVCNGAVTDIEILEENDTPDFFERAEAIIDDVIDEQSLEVDTVSGAMYSSSGILNAVNNALESAVTDGELEKNETEISSGSQKGRGRRPGKNRKNGLELLLKLLLKVDFSSRLNIIIINRTQRASQ